MSGATAVEARIERRSRALAAALVVAVATTVITGCAHAIGGGAAPDALLLAAALVATLVVAPVLGPAATPARRVAAVVLAQALQHALYAVPDSSGAPALHDHAPTAVIEVVPQLDPHAAMPLAHVAAGLVTLWLLRAAPCAVAAALDAVSLRIAVVALDWVPMPARRRASVVAASPARRASLDVLRNALERRGPPLLVG